MMLTRKFWGIEHCFGFVFFFGWNRELLSVIFFILFYIFSPPKQRQRFSGETNGNNKKVIERNNKIWNQVKERGEKKFFKHLEIHVVCFESFELLKKNKT